MLITSWLSDNECVRDRSPRHSHFLISNMCFCFLALPRFVCLNFQARKMNVNSVQSRFQQLVLRRQPFRSLVDGTSEFTLLVRLQLVVLSCDFAFWTLNNRGFMFTRLPMAHKATDSEVIAMVHTALTGSCNPRKSMSPQSKLG
jgi:hypothetical protein